MDGHFPPAIRTVFSRCSDPSREGDLTDWYGRVHFPDVLGSGVAQRGFRYRNAEHQSGEPSYLVIYEFDTDDFLHVNKAFSELLEHLQHAGRMHPAVEVIRRTQWRRTGPAFTTARSKVVSPGGLWLIESDCTATDRLNEFNRWYDDVHIPDFLATGLFITAYRFEAVVGQPGSRYLALYETDGDPADAVDAFVREHRPGLRAAGRLSDIIDVTRRAVYRALQAAAA